MARTLPEVLHEIEQLIVELLESQVAVLKEQSNMR